MFELANVARPGVSEYISGSGALSALDNRLEGFRTPLIVTGEKSYAAFTKFYKGNREFRVAKYDGSASFEDMQRIADEFGEGVDVVLGVGGAMLKFESIHFELPAMALAAISGVLLNAFLPKKEK